MPLGHSGTLNIVLTTHTLKHFLFQFCITNHGLLIQVTAVPPPLHAKSTAAVSFKSKLKTPILLGLTFDTIIPYRYVFTEAFHDSTNFTIKYE